MLIILIIQRLKYANERRRLYKIRHEKYRKIKNTPSYFADNILW